MKERVFNVNSDEGFFRGTVAYWNEIDENIGERTTHVAVYCAETRQTLCVLRIDMIMSIIPLDDDEIERAEQ